MNDGETRATDPLIGQMVGEYRIESQLGSGGMGIVYRGTHCVIGKPVAIKVLRSEGDAEHTSRLLAEARTVSALRHRGIADIFGFGTVADGRPYIVMELLEGKALDQVLRERGTMTVAEALWVLDEALGPLAAAHSSGVIHRDIKPSNFFISQETEGTRYLKVLDFGLAKRRSGENLTAVGSVLGTPDYMSPEQAQAKSVGPGADLYSLGATMFEILTGAPPFVGASPMEIMVQHVHSPAPKVSEKVSGIPPEIDELISEMLEKEPAKRLSSAHELKLRVARLRKKFAREVTSETEVPHATTSAAAPVVAAPVAPPPSAAAPARMLTPRSGQFALAHTQPTPARGSPEPAVAHGGVGLASAGPGRANSPVLAPPSESLKRLRSGGRAWKWAAMFAGLCVLVGVAGVLLMPRGVGVPTTRPPPHEEVLTPPPDRPVVGTVATQTDAGNAEQLAGAAATVADAGVSPMPDKTAEIVKPKVPTKLGGTKRKPPPAEKTLEARIKRGELALRARAKRGDGDPIAAQLLKSLKDELEKNPGKRQSLSKELAQWERTYLR